MVATGVLVVPSVAACSSSGTEQQAYCVDANNQVVDEVNCDESHGYGGGLFFLMLASGGYGRGSVINGGGARINPADSAARAAAGLPATGRAAGTTVKAGGIGHGSGGSTGTGSHGTGS